MQMLPLWYFAAKWHSPGEPVPGCHRLGGGLSSAQLPGMLLEKQEGWDGGHKSPSLATSCQRLQLLLTKGQREVMGN